MEACRSRLVFRRPLPLAHLASSAPDGARFAPPLALQNGIDVKTVSSMLGHSSAGFTLATYTHATNKVQEQAAAKMGNLLKRAL